MKEYSRSLGFEFEPAWAYLMPLEKVLAFKDGNANGVTLDEEDNRLIESLALPLDKALEVSKEARRQSCELRDRQMTLTSEGEVMLCCTVYDRGKYSLGPFLEIPLDRLQEMKYRHSLCGTCMKNGIHVLFTYGTESLDRVALDNVKRHYPDARLESMRGPAGEKRRRGLRAWRRKAARTYNGILSRIGIGN